VNRLLDYLALVFALSFSALWLSVRVGTSFLGRKRPLQRDISADFSTILVSTLTLNGLIIGFTFSMAMTRYEERKSYEVLEANAINTEYLRANLLSVADAAKVQSLLRNYLDQRISFYTAPRNERELREIDTRTAQLQADLWAAVRDVGVAQPTPTIALAVAGMNDVLNSQGYAQAAWWNRIPTAAWILMSLIAVIANLLFGYGAQNFKSEKILVVVLPLVLSVSFLLIADMESPRGGIIRVNPQNLITLADSLRAQ
jgi:hypothetical protein